MLNLALGAYTNIATATTITPWGMLALDFAAIGLLSFMLTCVLYIHDRHYTRQLEGAVSHLLSRPPGRRERAIARRLAARPPRVTPRLARYDADPDEDEDEE